MQKFMSILVLIVCIFGGSFAVADDSNPIADAVLAHSAVTSLYTLLNAANGNSCPAPKSQDVQTFCFGALPEVTQPTIAGDGCGFTLKISCSNGASATISGANQSYVIVDQNHKVSGLTSVGIIIRDVSLSPAH